MQSAIEPLAPWLTELTVAINNYSKHYSKQQMVGMLPTIVLPSNCGHILQIPSLNVYNIDSLLIMFLDCLFDRLITRKAAKHAV